MYNVRRIIIFMIPNPKACFISQTLASGILWLFSLCIKDKITNIYLIHILYI